MNKSYFTTSITRNLLILIIPPLPGCVAYLLAKGLISDELFYGLLPLTIRLGVLLILFPLTFKITNTIKRGGYEK